MTCPVHDRVPFLYGYFNLIFSTHTCTAYPIAANRRALADAGLRAMKQAQKPENENGFGTL